MKVKNYRKRVVAGVLAVLMMVAAVPAGTDFGGFFGGSDIKVSAEVATKTEWAVGDTFDLTGSWVVPDDEDSDTRVHISGPVAVPESIKGASQRKFIYIFPADKISYSPSGQTGDISGAYTLYLTPPSGKTIADTPTGFKIKGGSGTQADPYTFELVYPKTEWAVGDTFDLTGSWVVPDDENPDARVHISGAAAVPESGATGSQRKFSNFCPSDKVSYSPSDQPVDYSSTYTLYIAPPSGKTAADVPTGFKIKGGSGTLADPYTFELVYAQTTEWAVGDTFDLTGSWVVPDDEVPNTRVHLSSAVAVPESYSIGSIGTGTQWVFDGICPIDKRSSSPSAQPEDKNATYTLYITPPSGKTADDKPSGFKIKGGSGTQADPYTFELVYSEKADATVTGDPQPCDLTYSGQAQPLVTEGTAEGGTMQYALAPEVKIVERDTLTPLDSVEVGTVYVPSGNIGVVLPAGYDLKVGDKTYIPSSTYGINLYYNNGGTYLYHNKNGGEGGFDLIGGGVLGLLVTDISGGLITGEFVDPKNATSTPKEEDWTDSVPTATDAGNYTVYYRAKGDADHNDSAPKSVTATIKKADPTVTAPQPCDLTYSGEAQALVTEGTTSGGTMQYVAKPEVKVVERNTLTRLDSVEVGTVYVPSGNDGVILPTGYNLKVGNTIYTPESTFGINLYLYNGNTRLVYGEMEDDVLGAGVLGLLVTDISGGLITGEFVDAEEVTGTPKEEDWTDSVPTATDAGNYTVYYRVKGDDNYNDVAAASVTATIKKADPTVTGAPQPCDLTYTGSAQALVTAATVSGGTVKYALGDNAQTAPTGEYSETVPTRTNAGDYYVWYKVVGDANHNDAAPVCVTATIKQAAATVTANNITRKWGEQDPALTYDVVGLIGNDSLTGELARAEGEDVGTYDITQGTLANPNYNITFTGATFTIETSYFTITFVNEDGTVLQTSEIANGVIPEFKGETPTKASTVQEEFTFKGWDKEVTAVTGAATYTATYESKRIGAEVNRLAGANRFETAVEISKAGFEKADSVILTSGTSYADGIAGVPLAARLGAPILLTASDKLSEETLAEIERLGAKNVYILGGEGAISADVEKALQEKELQVWRIAGNNRYETSAAIAQRVCEDPTDIFFVYGNGFADTLSVSAIAARKNAPIVYLTTDGDLDASIAQYLAVLKDKGCVKNAYVIGGTSVISDDMMNKAVAALGLESATRIAGSDRYATSAEVNKAFVDNFDSDELCVATGADFADAVAGGVYAAAKKAPFILVSSNLNDEQSAFINSRAPMKINVFGGTAAVSEDTVKAVIDAIVTVPNSATLDEQTQPE